jgi:hypothetical protein
MLTAHQQQTCVRAISVALGAYTSPEVAQERARNITQVLDLSMPQRDRLSAIADALLCRNHDVREFWKAVSAAELAFAMAVQTDNLARFSVLVSCVGYSPTEASKYLQDNGWTLPEGVVAA